MLRYAVRLAAVAMLAAAGLGVPAAAQAATCSTSHGVTVVVDFHQLGGGVQTACDAGGAGRSAAQQLKDAGHTLTYVQRQPGFVCRVDGSPADDPCVNTPPDNAYWSLWWSDGKSGTWSYSAQGVGALQVPDGGYVALSWQGGDGKAPPRVTPKAHAAPSPTPTGKPSHRPTAHATAPATASPPDAPTSAPPSSRVPTASPLHPSTHKPSASAAPSSRPTHAADSTQAAVPVEAADAASDGSDGLPGWVAPLLVVLLLGAAATVAVVRRKRSGGT